MVPCLLPSRFLGLRVQHTSRPAGELTVPVCGARNPSLSQRVPIVDMALGWPGVGAEVKEASSPVLPSLGSLGKRPGSQLCGHS